MPAETFRPTPSPATLRRSTLVAAAVIGVLVVVTLAWAVSRDGAVVAFDQHVLRTVVAHRTAAMTAVMKFATSFGGLVQVIAVDALGVCALVWCRRKDLAVVLVATATGMWFLVRAMKRLVHRLRPPVAVHLVDAGGWSFPSGHAGQATASFLALGLLIALAADRRWVRRAAVVVGVASAVLIGASRVYLGVHWASDVVAGWSLGVAWFAALLAVNEVRRSRRDRSEFTVPSP